MTIDAREERRRNTKALAIVGVTLIVLGALAYRPATVISIQGDALMHSIGGTSIGAAKCVKEEEDRWRCRITDGSSYAGVNVATRAFGCWDLIRPTSEARSLATESAGCINGFDVLVPSLLED